MVDELQRAVAVTQVVQCDGLGKHIVSHTADLHRIRREKLASIHEATSLKRDWVVSLVHDEHTDDTLITVDNEIATKLIHVLFLGDQL